MALSSDATWLAIVTKDIEGIMPMSMILKNAAVVYYGSFCTHDDTDEEIKPYDGSVADRAVGWHFHDSATGNSSAPRTKARILRGGFQARIPVTGLNGTTPSLDYGDPVYISDDGTYTLTGTTTTMRVGRVVANSTGVTAGTNAWVAMRDMFGRVGGE